MSEQSPDHKPYYTQYNGQKVTRPQYNQIQAANQRAEAQWASEETQRKAQLVVDERAAEQKWFNNTIESLEASGEGRGDNPIYQSIASFRWAYLQSGGNMKAAINASANAYNWTQYNNDKRQYEQDLYHQEQDFKQEILARDAYARANTAEHPFPGSNQSPINIQEPVQQVPIQQDLSQKQWAQAQVKAFNTAISSKTNPYKSGSPEWWTYETTRRDIDANLNFEGKEAFLNPQVYGNAKINDDNSVSFSWKTDIPDRIAAMELAQTGSLNPFKSGTQQWWSFETTKRQIDAENNFEKQSLLPVGGTDILLSNPSVKTTPYQTEKYISVTDDVFKPAKELLFKIPGAGLLLTTIAKGYRVNEALKPLAEKENYDKLATESATNLSLDSKKYSANLQNYNKNLIRYNQRLEAYTTNPTAPVFASLQKTKKELDAQKSILDTLKSSLDTKIGVVESAKSTYDTNINKIFGNTNMSAPARQRLQEFNTEYEKKFVGAIRRQTRGEGLSGDITVGISQTPEMFSSLLSTGLFAYEGIVKSLPNLPKTISRLGAGAVLFAGITAQGLYSGARKNPGELAGQLLGGYLATEGLGILPSKVVGVARTIRKTPLPIESYGYPPELGYPLGDITSTSLKRSFEEGRLYPYPKTMKTSIGLKEVPYVPGWGGELPARLPNAKPLDLTLYTAHASDYLSKGAKVGDIIKITTPGSSELSGVYGAPILESYFSKTGIGKSKGIGFELPKINKPTAYSTVVTNLEIIPRNARSKPIPGTLLKSGMDAYLQRRAAKAPAGTSFLPLIKPEYESVIPMNSLLEVTGRKYYTKVGGIDLTKLGFSDKHFFGDRIPIVEQRLISFDGTHSTSPVIKGKNIITRSTEEKITSPLSVNLFNMIPGAAAYKSSYNPPSVGRITLLGYRSGGISRIYPKVSAAYPYGGSSVSVSKSGSSLPRASRNVSRSGSNKSSKSTKGSLGVSSISGFSGTSKFTSPPPSYKGSSPFTGVSSGIYTGGSHGGSPGGRPPGSPGGGSSTGRPPPPPPPGSPGGGSSSRKPPPPLKPPIIPPLFGSSRDVSGRKQKRKQKFNLHWEYAPGATTGEAWSFLLGSPQPVKKKKNIKKIKGTVKK